MNKSIDTNLSARTLKPAEIRRIIAAEEAYTAEVQANPMIWLPERQIISLDPSEVTQFGFQGLVRPQDLDFDIDSFNGPEDLENLARRGGKRGRKQGGGRQRKPSGPQNMPSAQVADQVVAQYFQGVKPAGNTGDLVFGEQNALFGSKQKAITYDAAWRRIVEPHHLMFWSEIEYDFLKQLGQSFGYGYWASKANTRNQAVGIMAHPRLKKVAGPFSYDKMASVQGIPDLRPAFCVVFEDIWSGLIIKAIVVHLKSMRGGEKLTAPVRYQQCAVLVTEIGNAKPGIKPAMKNQQVRNIWKNQVFGRGFTDHGTLTVTVPVCVLPEEERKLDMQERIKRAFVAIGGDWNCHLDRANDTDPLKKAGYGLIDPTNNTSTQAHGGRLDGWHAEAENFPNCDVNVTDGPDEVTV